MARLDWLILLVLSHGLAHGAGEVAQSFTLDGRVYNNTAATAALLDANIQLKIQILNPAQDCILYEETQNVNTLTTGGYFTVSGYTAEPVG